MRVRSSKLVNAGRWVAVSTACALAVTACSSSGSTQSGKASNTGTPTASASPTVLTAAGLAADLESGGLGIKSAHLTLAVSAAGQDVVAQGDETLASGKLTALNLDEKIGTMALSIRIIGSSLYVKLPPTLAPGTKPWFKASAASSNPMLKQLAASIASTQQSASLDSYRAFASAATSIKVVGSTTVGGAPATHYALVVDVSKLPASSATAPLAKAGIKTLPVDLWVDQQHRPVQIVEKLTVQGQPVTTTVTIGNFDAPVSISAPPASQVAIG